MRKRLIFLAIFYFPGTVLHELSHFVAAKLLGVQTGKISLFPKFQNDGLQLGSVEIAKTNLVKRFLIGIAPLIVGILILAFIAYEINSYTFYWYVYVVFGYGVLTVANTMNLSKSDLTSSWKILLILVLALVFIIALH